MTDCPECITASQALHHIFRVGCMGCTARAVARSLDFSEAKKVGKRTRLYLADLARCGVTHEQVAQAMKDDYMTRETSNT